jgi:hypothetical protein
MEPAEIELGKRMHTRFFNRMLTFTLTLSFPFEGETGDQEKAAHKEEQAKQELGKRLHTRVFHGLHCYTDDLIFGRAGSKSSRIGGTQGGAREARVQKKDAHKRLPYRPKGQTLAQMLTWNLTQWVKKKSRMSLSSLSAELQKTKQGASPVGADPS